MEFYSFLFHFQERWGWKGMHRRHSQLIFFWGNEDRLSKASQLSATSLLIFVEFESVFNLAVILSSP
jgi:hypothetical protein